ncbi:unnamed protein product [Rotaria magnacalcarata]
MSTSFSNLRAEAKPFFPSSTINFKEIALSQIRQWGFKTRDQLLVDEILLEWLTAGTLEKALKQWENITSDAVEKEQIPLNTLSYNVQGWGSRSLEVTDIVFKIEASVCVFTEVGELWNTSRIPHFNIFHQEGTNKSGGVIIAIGKHLKGTRVNFNVENTVIVDVIGLSETIRIIGIYWPAGQARVLEELEPFIIENTIITGDFNASIKEWGSEYTDKRGKHLKEWIERNNLCYIPSTSHSSKRSNRNIDLTFTNIGQMRGETLKMGTSDHWPLMLTCENVSFDKNRMFSYVNWKVYEAILTLLQDYWIREQNKGMKSDDWYTSYVRFLATLKNRLTQWKAKEKFRPALPSYIILKLKELKRIRNKYYHERSKNNAPEETRVLLRVLTREVRIEIAKYKSSNWQEFLSTIQETHDNTDKAFWLHLSKIYRHSTLPFKKLNTGNKTTSDEREISEELFKYYSEQFKAKDTDMSDPNEAKIETEYQALVNKLLGSNVIIEKTSAFEVKKYILKLKPKKSSGFDLVSNFMIKRVPPGYINCLVNCFNTWLSEYRYPDFWKIAKIITLNKLKEGVPRCEQTRPISLLATHSKIFEKIVLERVRSWAESNKLVPIEQSGFRPGGLLPTRVLSIYQEVKNNITANIPTAAIYVDYQKAYDKVWHKGLVVKFNRLNIPEGLLKLIISWLNDRCAYVVFGGSKSETFPIHLGLPQGSSLSPYLFIVFHSDLVSKIGAHSCHIFADDLNVLITPPISRSFKSMLNFLEKEGTRVCSEIAEYSKKWKQPINFSKTVVQIFHSQVQNPVVDLYIEGHKMLVVKEFKYLGFTWTNKMSLKPTIDSTLEKIQNTYSKLRWMKGGKTLSKEVLRKCFFAYSFPYFAWLLPLYPFLPQTQKELLIRKFRNGLRLVHRCPFARATELHQITNEIPLEEYGKKYIKKRLAKLDKSDLIHSYFYNDLFYWNSFQKRKNDNMGHFFRMKRVRNLQERHRSLLLGWLEFLDK